MMDIVIKNGNILTLEGGIKRGGNIEFKVMRNSDIGIKNGKIVFLGKCNENAKEIIELNGEVVIPGFIDPHTHTLFAGNRANEFDMKIKGKSYMEIRKEGGGIMNTVRKTREAGKEDLKKLLRENLKDMLLWGVTSVEIKSGYGLDRENEIKMLEVINDVKKEFNVYPTFLGAHDFPPERNREDYIQEILGMIPEVSKRGLAKFIDVFCEENVYTKEEARKILVTGREHNLIPKIHADEIKSSGGAEIAGEIGCISADHLIHPSEKGLDMMRDSGTIAVLLPFTSFFLNEKPAPVEKLREKGIPIAIGTDFNPGSSPLKYLPIAGQFASTYLKLSIEETIAGMTINAAFALNIQEKKGSIEIGKDADIVITKYKDYREIVYWFGENPVNNVIKGGEKIE
uniref:Imidazolonepropionase n=1 Tax=candidate division WOR-3 bacterium TaxID=2052148 RepID=A0A7C4YIF7_UNCW3